MAEYIELSELQKFCREYTEVDAVGLILADRTDLLHTADVVERSRIDKAIAEITNLNRYQEGIDTMNVGDDLMISWCKTLDILKEI